MNGNFLVYLVKFKVNNYKPKQKNMKKSLLLLFAGLTLATTMRSQCVTNCSYSLSSITPSVTPAAGPAVISGDDAISGALPIGFTFTFMCNTYTSAYVSTNGFLSFSAVGSGCCSGVQCPSLGGAINNYIAASWMDLNTSNGGTITAQTIGTTPNQVYIVTYSNVAYYSGLGVYNGQIKIYETTNVIEIHTFNSNRGTNLFTTCTQGIQDVAGNVGYPTPGRNSTIWTASVADAYRFTPTGTSPVPTQPSVISGPASVASCSTATIYSVTAIPTATAYTWTLPSGWVGTSTTNTISVIATGTGIMGVTASYSCGTSAQKNLYVTAPAGPTVTAVSSASALCAGQSATITASGTANTYSWSTSATTASISVSPTVTTIYSVVGTNTTNSCSQTVTTSIAVNALPTVSVTSGAICAGNSFTMVPSGASTYTFSSGSAVVTPTATANYNVTGTSAAGCVSSNTAVSSVTVNAAPSVSVNSGAVCAGNSFTMVPSGGATYTFSSGSAVVTPTATAAYTVSSTSTVGCVGSAVSNVTVNALPSVSLSAAQNTACTNSSTIALTGSPSGGVYTGSNVASGAFTPGAAAGTFVQSYAYTNTLTGCSKTATSSIVVSVCLGLNTTSAKINGLSVYPNPSNGEFTVELNNGINKTIEVTDVAGRVVLTTTSLNDKVNVNINSLTNGIYFVKIVSNTITNVIKVVKQ